MSWGPEPAASRPRDAHGPPSPLSGALGPRSSSCAATTCRTHCKLSAACCLCSGQREQGGNVRLVCASSTTEGFSIPSAGNPAHKSQCIHKLRHKTLAHVATVLTHLYIYEGITNNTDEQDRQTKRKNKGPTDGSGRRESGEGASIMPKTYGWDRDNSTESPDPQTDPSQVSKQMDPSRVS